MTAAETPFAEADTGQTLRAWLSLRQAVAVSDAISPATAKAELRRTIRAARRDRLTADHEASTDHGVHRDYGTHIADRVMDLPEIRRACEQGLPIACYVSRPEEPPTAQLRDRLLGAGAILLLPRIHDDDLHWVHMAPATTWSVNRWGIEEPQGDPFPDSPALWIVPALAIDADGHRLGQGGGFYDRALAKDPGSQKIVIAIVFDDELIDRVPHEEHDVPVDIAITQNRSHRPF